MSTDVIVPCPSHKASPLEGLPVELLFEVIPYLQPSSLYALISTCRTLCNTLQQSLYHTIDTTNTTGRKVTWSGDNGSYRTRHIDNIFHSACLRNEFSKFRWVRVLGITDELLFRSCIDDLNNQQLVAFRRALPYMSGVRTLKISIRNWLEEFRINSSAPVEDVRFVISKLPSLRSVEISSKSLEFLTAMCNSEEMRQGTISSISVETAWSRSNPDSIEAFYDVLERNGRNLRTLKISDEYTDILDEYPPNRLDDHRLSLEGLRSIELVGGLFFVPSNIINYTHIDSSPPPQEFEDLASRTALQRLKIQSAFQYPQEEFTKNYIPANIKFHNLTVLELCDSRNTEWQGFDVEGVQLLPRGYLHSVVVANPRLREISCPCISDETLRVLAEPTRASNLEALTIYFPYSGDIEVPYTAAGIATLSACSRLKTLRFHIGAMKPHPKAVESLLRGSERLEEITVFHSLRAGNGYIDAEQKPIEAIRRDILSALFGPTFCDREWGQEDWFVHTKYFIDDLDEKGTDGFCINVGMLKAEMGFR
ncbi:hypothetical protein P167DRAFT_608408 [Morchella conica CCBAS932]|uniref:F-box domain-containing protein n=1 Tax=Morchella conica CCBAS932 TaxID=1392247 RepID=A0A3N4KI17_9PEZI|nr:hypothetical protein P167DRAFT_608408 [Morchella conica CCBAS932]